MMDKSRMDASAEDRDEAKSARKAGGKDAGKGVGKGAGKGAAKPANRARKPGAAGKAAGGAAKAAPAAGAGARAAADVVRKKEFVDRVLAHSGASKAATKACVDATLRVLAEAIASGEALSIAGFGKTRVSRHVARSGSDSYVLRFKPMQPKDGAKGVEEDDDDV